MKGTFKNPYVHFFYPCIQIRFDFVYLLNNNNLGTNYYNYFNFRAYVSEIILFQTASLLLHSSSAIAVLVFACNRVTVTRCLDQLLKYRPDPNLFPIIVSQDCQHEPTAKVIQSYGDQLYHMQVRYSCY